MKDDRTGETSHHFHIKDEDVKSNNEGTVRVPPDDQSRGEIIKKLNKMFADLEEEYDSREQFIQTTADLGQEDTKQHIVPHPAGNKSDLNLGEKQSSASNREIKVTEKESINNDEIKVNENISENTVTEMMLYNPQRGLSKLNVG